MYFKKSSLAIAVSTSLLVTGCLEVEDKELATKLEEQNALLQTQNEQNEAQNAKTESVTITGKVVDASRANMPVSAGSISYRLGATWSEPAAFTDGAFEITGLPGNSYVELMVEPAADATADTTFLPMTIATTTNYADENQAVTYDNVGTISVSKGMEYSFGVTNMADDSSVTDLMFMAGSGLNMYYGSYDATTAMYNITLPTVGTPTVSASLDMDYDGEADYWVKKADDYYNVLNILSSEIEYVDNISLMMVEDMEETTTTITVNLTIVDDNGDPIPDLMVTGVQDTMLDGIAATYNSTTGQYSASVGFVTSGIVDSDSISFYVFPMVEDGQTSSIWNDGGIIQVNYYSHRPNNVYYWEYDSSMSLEEADYVSLVDGVANIHVGEDIFEWEYGPGDGGKSAELVVWSQDIEGPEYDFKMYFSNAISLFTDEQDDLDDDDVSDNFQLIHEKLTLKEVKDGLGDPTGETTVELVETQVDIVVSQSLGNTALTISPDESLGTNQRYSYEFGKVQDANTHEDINLSGVNDTFNTDSGGTFSINDLKLENFNYTTEGADIVDETSDGVDSNSTNSSEDLRIVFPSSSDTIDYLSLRLISSTNDDRATGEETVAHNQQIVFKEDGSWNFVSEEILVKAAEGEIVTNMTGGETVRLGGSLSSNFYFVSSSWLWTGYTASADNTETATNEATFEYRVITDAGVESSGQITLEVK